jgi:hypothetical protein
MTRYLTILIVILVAVSTAEAQETDPQFMSAPELLANAKYAQAQAAKELETTQYWDRQYDLASTDKEREQIGGLIQKHKAISKRWLELFYMYRDEQAARDRRDAAHDANLTVTQPDQGKPGHIHTVGETDKQRDARERYDRQLALLLEVGAAILLGGTLLYLQLKRARREDT